MLLYFWNREAGSSSVTGSLSVTLGAMVLAATGVVGAQGAGAVTLAPMLVSGTGKVQVSGAASTTFDKLSLAGAGTVRVSGALNASLEALTLAGSGHVQATTITGTASITLGPVALAGTGTVAASTSQVQALLDTSRIQHVKGIQFKRARNIPAYLEAMTKARNLRLEALALDPDRSEQAWINEANLVQRRQNTHDALMMFYQQVLG